VTLSLFLVVAVGGLIGAPARYLLDRAITGRLESDLPWGTFVINITGSLLLGLVTGLTLAGHLPPIGKALLGTGFCGAYTTFSTFTFETLTLLEDGRFLEAVGTVAASVGIGLAAAAGGLAIGLAL
jgi:fluoride exporter